MVTRLGKCGAVIATLCVFGICLVAGQGWAEEIGLGQRLRAVEIERLPLSEPAVSIAISPDGDYVAVSTMKAALVARVAENGKFIRLQDANGAGAIALYGNPCRGLAYRRSAAGTALAAFSCIGESQGRIATDAFIPQRISPNGCDQVGLSGDERVYVLEKSHSLWRLALSGLNGRVAAFVGSPSDCSFYLAIERAQSALVSIFRFDPKAGQQEEIAQLPKAVDRERQAVGQLVALSPSGRLMAVSSLRYHGQFPEFAEPSWSYIDVVDLQRREVVSSMAMDVDSEHISDLTFISDRVLLYVTGRGCFLVDPALKQKSAVNFGTESPFIAPLKFASTAGRLAVAGVGEIRVYEFAGK